MTRRSNIWLRIGSSFSNFWAYEILLPHLHFNFSTNRILQKIIFVTFEGERLLGQTVLIWHFLGSTFLMYAVDPLKQSLFGPYVEGL